MAGFFQCIHKAGLVGTAVAFNDDAAQTEENRTVEFARVEFVFHAFQGGDGGDGGQFVEQGELKFFPDGAAHEFNRAFDGFQHNVTDKAVGDNHIHFAGKNAVAFHVADEIQFAAPQQLECPFGRVRAFDVFRADVEQADDDIRESEQDTAEPQS